MAKKRANGEGSIRKRSDGRWEGRYTVGYDENGKVKMKNVLGKTQAEVKEKLKEKIEEAKVLDVSKSESYTVAEWAALWFEIYAKPRTYASALRTTTTGTSRSTLFLASAT